jgi:hypothetical protein
MNFGGKRKGDNGRGRQYEKEEEKRKSKIKPPKVTKKGRTGKCFPELQTALLG